MTDRQTNARRAVVAYNAMQRHFFANDGTSLYREIGTWLGPGRHAYLWEFSRALSGTLALAGLPNGLVGGVSYAADVQDRFRGLEQYWNATASPPAYDSNVPSQGGGDRYYDDNAWVALSFIQLYRMGLTTSLERATQLWAFATSGWDRIEGDPFPGGIFWVQQERSVMGHTNHDRGAGVTGGGAELGFHLHLLTGSSDYDGDGMVAARPASLGATNMLNWVNAHLDSSRDGTGLFWNAVRRDGSVDTNIWSYVQGTMIGANVLRFQVTADASHLERAVGIARKTLAYHDGFTGQTPQFVAMLLQNVLMLLKHDGSLRDEALGAIQTYGDWAWNDPSVRDPKTSLFYFTEGGQPNRSRRQTAQLRDQGAMVQLYALLAWDPADYGKLT